MTSTRDLGKLNEKVIDFSALHLFSLLDGSPAERQGNEKLVYRLIQLFSSTEIFSKRRKIYASWRKTRVNKLSVQSDIGWTLGDRTCGSINVISH